TRVAAIKHGNEPRSAHSLPPLLDAVKGVAILAVVLYHIFKLWFGWQGVHVFIVLSGFGLTRSLLSKPSPVNWGEWFRRRAFRILPPYLMAVGGGFALFLVSLWIAGTIRMEFRETAFQFGFGCDPTSESFVPPYFRGPKCCALVHFTFSWTLCGLP